MAYGSVIGVAHVLKGSRQLYGVLCGTAIAERAITQPDIVLALDPGQSRRCSDLKGVLDFVDVPAPPAVHTQRRGRIGRVAPGACIRTVQSGTEPHWCVASSSSSTAS